MVRNGERLQRSRGASEAVASDRKQRESDRRKGKAADQKERPARLQKAPFLKRKRGRGRRAVVLCRRCSPRLASLLLPPPFCRPNFHLGGHCLSAASSFLQIADTSSPLELFSAFRAEREKEECKVAFVGIDSITWRRRRSGELAS